MASSKGEIRADALYSREQLQEFGIGYKTLSAMHEAGLQRRYVGNCVWYHGQELIEFVLKTGRKVRSKRKEVADA